MVETIVIAVGIFIAAFFRFLILRETLIYTFISAFIATLVALLVMADSAYSLHIRDIYYRILFASLIAVVCIIEMRRVHAVSRLRNIIKQGKNRYGK